MNKGSKWIKIKNKVIRPREWKLKKILIRLANQNELIWSELWSQANFSSIFHTIYDFKGDVNYFLKANEDRIKNQRKADIENEILGVELLEDNL